MNTALNDARSDSWESTTLAFNNQSLMTDPTIWQPDFELPHRIWCALNHFRISQGLSAANLCK